MKLAPPVGQTLMPELSLLSPKTEQMLPHTFLTVRQSTSPMNFFVFLRLGIIKEEEETVALIRKSKI